MAIPDPPRRSTAEIAAVARRSVVVVQAGGALGSGFAIDQHSVATALHVVAGAQTISVRDSAGAHHEVASIRYLEAADIAILVTAGTLRPLPLGDSGEVSDGEPVTIVSSPRGLELSVTTGVVSARRKIANLDVFQLTAPISPGSSGGPVLNENGEVIGIVRAYLEGGQALNFATAIGSLKALKRSQVPGLDFEVPEFARLTKPKEAEGKPEAPMAAAPTPPPRPLFPSNVAGFEFGTSITDLRFLCAEERDRRFARAGLSWQTLLRERGINAGCPWGLVPVDFAQQQVFFSLLGNRVVVVGLVAAKREYALSRLQAKYGGPSAVLVGGRWQPSSAADVRRRDAEGVWLLDGGKIRVADGATPFIFFEWSAPDALLNAAF